MRFAHPFVLAAALLGPGSALAGDAWYVADDANPPTDYEEVSDNVYMPKGLFDSLHDSDLVLDLIEDSAAEQSKKSTEGVGYLTITDSFQVMYCVEYTNTFTYTDSDGTTRTVTETLTVCST